MAKKKRKGPTPRRRPPKMRWMAGCEQCGAVDVIFHERSTGSLHSPCPLCGCPTARYAEQLVPTAA